MALTYFTGYGLAIIFGIRNTNNFEFKLGDNKIGICDEFKYLGTVFTKHCTFFKAIKHNVDHAKKKKHAASFIQTY